MESSAIQHLDDAVAEVFLLMLARTCQPWEGACGGEAASLSSQVIFSGTLRGACRLDVPRGAANELTAELTGGHATEVLTRDTVSELCNMIAGLWKSRQPPPAASCGLSEPKEPEEVAARYTVIRVYRFDPYCLRLVLALE